MTISSLRLRLAVWFGAAFLVGLLVLDVAFVGYERRKAEARLAGVASAEAIHLRDAVRRERLIDPSTSSDSTVREVLAEWPAGIDAILILDRAGRRVGSRGPEGILNQLAHQAADPRNLGTTEVPVDDERALRISWCRDPEFGGLIFLTGSFTTEVQEEGETLLGWLLISAPIIGLASAAGGYLLARRALGPIRAMAQSLDAIDVRRLDSRLPVGSPPDELGLLASHFNGLLDRLAAARLGNRRFLEQAAHQLRTPLTIVRGESTLGLDQSRTIEEHRQSLRRVSLAAELMSRRVGDLLLLAETEAGERPVLSERVELDGIAVDAVDLMRGRASALARALAYGRIEPAMVRGAGLLLREAVTELLENACRHGDPMPPVEVDVLATGDRAQVVVRNAGPAIPDHPHTGLGLSIVRWIADVHDGHVEIRRLGTVNSVILSLPLVTAIPAAG